MSNSVIAVEVENQYLVELFRLGREWEGGLHLTTVEENQRMAFVKVFFYQKEKNREKKELLTTIKIENLDRLKKAGVSRPKIDLTGKMSGRRTLELRTYLEGKLHSTTTVDVGKYLSHTFFKRFVPIAAGIVAVAFLLFFFVPGIGPSLLQPSSGAPSPEARTPETRTPETRTPETAAEVEKQPAREKTEAGPIAEKGGAETGPDEEEIPKQEISKMDEETGAGAGREAEDEVPEAVPEEREWTVYFRPDRAYLTEESVEVLQRIAEILQQYPDGKVVVSGHCALYGTESGRRQLSEERAKRVYDFLKEQGWEPDENDEIEWYGAEKYVTDSRNKQHLNRRVQIELSF